MGTYLLYFNHYVIYFFIFIFFLAHGLMVGGLLELMILNVLFKREMIPRELQAIFQLCLLRLNPAVVLRHPSIAKCYFKFIGHISEK